MAQGKSIISDRARKTESAAAIVALAEAMLQPMGDSKISVAEMQNLAKAERGALKSEINLAGLALVDMFNMASSAGPLKTGNMMALTALAVGQRQAEKDNIKVGPLLVEDLVASVHELLMAKLVKNVGGDFMKVLLRQSSKALNLGEVDAPSQRDVKEFFTRLRDHHNSETSLEDTELEADLAHFRRRRAAEGNTEVSETLDTVNTYLEDVVETYSALKQVVLAQAKAKVNILNTVMASAAEQKKSDLGEINVRDYAVKQVKEILKALSLSTDEQKKAKLQEIANTLIQERQTLLREVNGIALAKLYFEPLNGIEIFQEALSSNDKWAAEGLKRVVITDIHNGIEKQAKKRFRLLNHAKDEVAASAADYVDTMVEAMGIPRGEKKNDTFARIVSRLYVAANRKTEIQALPDRENIIEHLLELPSSKIAELLVTRQQNGMYVVNATPDNRPLKWLSEKSVQKGLSTMKKPSTIQAEPLQFEEPAAENADFQRIQKILVCKALRSASHQYGKQNVVASESARPFVSDFVFVN